MPSLWKQRAIASSSPSAQLFPHLEDDRSGIGDDGRVMDKDGVGMVRQRLVMVNHFGTSLAQDRDQRVMLLPAISRLGRAV